MGGTSSCPKVDECDYTDYRLRSECPTTAEMQKCNDQLVPACTAHTMFQDMVPRQQYNDLETFKEGLEDRMKNMVPKQNFEELQGKLNRFATLTDDYQNIVKQNTILQDKLNKAEGKVNILNTEITRLRKNFKEEMGRNSEKLRTSREKLNSNNIMKLEKIDIRNMNPVYLANQIDRLKYKICKRYSPNECKRMHKERCLSLPNADTQRCEEEANKLGENCEKARNVSELCKPKMTNSYDYLPARSRRR